VPFPTALGILNRFYDSHGITNEQRGVVARNAFAASGSTAAAVLGNDTSVGQFGAIRTSIAQWTPQKLTDTQTKLNETLIHQVATLRTNMGSLAAILGKPLLLDATGAVHNLVLLTDKLIAFTTTHPAFTAMVAKFVEVGSIAALIAGPVIMLAGTLGALSVAGGLVATGFGIMGTAAGFLALGLAPLLIEFIPFIALAAGAVYIFEHWTNISRLLGQMLGWVGDKLHAFMVELGLAQDKTIPSANAYDPVTTHGHYIARKGAMQWIPDPGSTPIKPATGGGVSGVPATTVVHIHNHIHGVDHKTAKDLANTVTKHVSDNLADLHDKARTFGSSTPYPTRPGRLG